jgi:hypothetical protein
MALEVLFDVYMHPDTGHRIGFAQGDGRFIIALAADDKHKGGRQEVSSVSGVKALAQALRKGYVKNAPRMYFSDQRQSFVASHPELVGDWLLAAMSANPTQILGAVAAVAHQMPEEFLYREEVEHWVALQSTNRAYVVAANDTPLWSLLLAQVCMQNGWALRSQPHLGRLPDQPPSQAPDQWAQWLEHSFSQQSISDCLKVLGWTVEKIITSGTAPLDGGNLSAYL